MTKQSFCIMLLILGVCSGAALCQSLVPLDPGSISNGHVYLFDNVSGNLPDLAGNTNGTLLGGPQAVPGLNGGALHFDGVDDLIQLPDSTNINTGGPHTTRTLIIVFNCDDVRKAGKQTIFEEGGNTRGMVVYVFDGSVYIGAWNRAEYNWNGEWISAPIGSGEWHVVALVLRNAGGSVEADKFEMWLDGDLIEVRDGGQIHGHSDDIGIGGVNQNAVYHDGNAGGTLIDYFGGIIDELWILNQELSHAELAAIGLTRTNASGPSPASGTTDLPYYARSLAWSAGDFVATHNLYLGTDFNDVNEATVDDQRGVLAGAGLTESAFEIPDTLLLGQTYHWRVDEVNAAPDNAVFKGEVWNFTTEPVAYTLANVTASASAQMNEFNGPENTVNGSGLVDGLHDDVATNMWLAPPGLPAWIQFEFDRAYVLHDMQIWNQNQSIESLVGFGAKDVTIETSMDGETFVALDGPGVFNQAFGLADYAANTTVDLSGVTAKFVKVTVNTSYGFLNQTGLAEVRFSYIPVYPREFTPAGGTDTDGLAVDLSWRAGRHAAKHQVLHSTDRAAVENGNAVVTTTSDKNYSLGGLEYGQLNYWQIVDVAADGTTYPSDIMYFYTAQTGVIDDMEMYKDEEFLEIWSFWVDGYNDNSNGSVVGNGSAPETVEVYEGSQSMPMAYDNSSAPLSEATRTFDPPLDLAAGNADNVGVYFKGVPYEYNGYYSQDGPGFWTDMSLNPLMVTISDEATIGLALTSHDVAAVATATFTDIQTSGGVSGDWTVEAIGSETAGHPAAIGSVTGSTATLSAAGNDIWNTADEFVYAYKQLSGEGAIETKVDTLDHTHDWAKAGVMIRNSADASASYASVQVTGIQGIRYQYRSADGTSADGDANILDGTQQLLSEPVWLKVERKLVNGPAEVYLKLTDSSNQSVTLAHPDPEATRLGDWTLLSIPLSDLTGVNLASIKSISVGVDGAGAVGRIYVDYLRQTRPLAIAPIEEASDDGLIAHYEFEDGGADSTGNYPGELFGNAKLLPEGKIGQALRLDVFSDATGVEVGSWMAIGLNYQHSTWPEVTVAAWARTMEETGQIIVSMDRDEYYRLEIAGNGGGPGQVGFCVQTDAGQLDYGSITRVDDGEWHHLAGVFDKGSARIFIDGRPEPGARNGSGFGRGNLRYGLIGANSEAEEFNGVQNATPAYFLGDIDDVRIYHRALSPGEVAGLALE